MRKGDRVPREGKIFYGWWIAATFFVTLFMAASIGATHSVFFKSIVGEFGWSRTSFSTVLSVNAVIGALLAPLWGRLVDRHGPRGVVPAGAAIVGLSMVLLSNMRSMLEAYLLYILLAFGAGGQSLVPISTALSQWFKRRRGLAIGITLVGAGVGGVALAPMASVLDGELGWRTGYLVFGIAIWVSLIPLLLLVLRRRPEDIGLLPDGDERPGVAADAEEPAEAPPEATGLSLGEAVRTPAFWLLALGFMLPMFAGRAIMIHLVPVITDAGISPQKAATAYGMTVGLSIVGRFGFGYAADKFSKRHIFALCYLIQAVGICFLIGLESMGPIVLVGFIIVFGCSYGGGLSLAPLLIAENFGIASMGVIFGALGIVAMIGGALGPIFAGGVYDAVQSYHMAFIVFLAVQLVASIAILNCRPAVTTSPGD
jgi:MFS family permease